MPAYAHDCGGGILPFDMLATPDNQRMVRAYVAALSRDAASADDLAQEVFLRAIERIDRLYQPEQAGAFLRGIARRVVQEHFKRRRRDARYEQEMVSALIDGSRPIAELCHDRAMLVHLRDAIAELPVISRRMLEMRYHDGLTATDIGAALTISSGAVRITLMRIRERLRARVEQSTRQRGAF
jgi:RNA polymerase sigma-70 factor (ECF subfamily)